MDMQMPVMDGYTATSTLRQAGLETPIVALTANAMKGFERECLEAGCTAYLTKPVDLDALVEELARLLGGERKSDAPQEPPLEDAVTPEESRRKWSGEDAPLVSRLASNPRFHATIAKFVCRLEEKLEAMQACWDAGDLEELAKLAHWLKGSGGTVGFDAFGGPAKTLELLAKEGKESEIEASLLELRQLAERVVVPGRDD
jgi:YesN/AraC family two-component response regulator